jgi:uncharacterized protein (TIGR04255 family)
MYDDVKYAKPFLAEVILRIDFSAPEPSLGKALPKEVKEAAIEQFPIAEPRAVIARAFKVSNTDIGSEREEFTEWNFFGRHREKRVAIGPQFLFVATTRYDNYDLLRGDFQAVAQPVFSAFPDLQANRIGLRYINKIERMEPEPYEWESLIDTGLLGLTRRFDDRDTVSRVFHIVEFKFEQVQVKFQFGLPNPDFPAPIRRSMFVLDLDGVANGPQSLSESLENADLAHARIQRLFESSITDGLRELMNVR